MHDLIRIESTPALVSVNFAELKEALAKELAKYDVVVTADTLPDAKKLATELNKTAGEIDRRRKEEVAKVSEPIRAFDDSMKELSGMCKDGRGKILKQVERFEDETREQCRALLAIKRQAMWDHYQVGGDYQSAEFDDLILVSSLTASGNLTAKAQKELESRVLADKSVQDRTERRLLELENASYKAGLAAPLTLDHVRPFLFLDAETYSRELTRILEAEVRRQEQAEQAMRERLEREARLRAEAEQREQARQEKPAETAQQEEPAKQELGGLPRGTQWEPEPAPTGKKRMTIVAVYHPVVDASLSKEDVERVFRAKNKRDGNSTLGEVTVYESQTEEAA